MRVLGLLREAFHGLREDIKMKISIIIIGVILLLAVQVSASEATVCCQKTTSGFYCQNVPASECASNSPQAPTSCSSTSFCRPGVCYNPNQGTCTDNTPQIVCNSASGQWFNQTVPQCNLGCCILGDQAAFVPLARCKYLAGKLGLQTNYNKAIKSEIECVLSVQNQDKGACVYESEFEKLCKFTTREECSGNINGTKSKGEFFNGKLCTAPELGTKCAATNKTICVPGKEEVYFVDNCGNPANIYDANKRGDLAYWSNVASKTEACNPGLSNANSKTCGNCNYLSGSICRAAKKGSGAPDNICANLNCMINGKERKHGESWCVYSDAGNQGKGDNAVGSRFYKHICINGEEVLEQCADYRQEECISDTISIGAGSFSQAACRVNRWQFCLVQDNQKDCENQDQRDCIWKPGISFNASASGVCVPKNSPGLKFWEGDEARNICAQASATCIVTWEESLTGGKECKENCQCIENNWQQQRQEVCTALGDCGSKTNWIGAEGYKPGFEYTREKA